LFTALCVCFHDKSEKYICKAFPFKTAAIISYMNTKDLLGGTIHKMPVDLKKALLADAEGLHAWNAITPLARNEWICWVEGAKLIETRARRVERTHKELAEGVRRPCCWPGCMHRKKNGKN
jgi:uncharacterized protein YdeI (YjbR/CyaY-like superfamily)